jgi:hypothetical protein
MFALRITCFIIKVIWLFLSKHEQKFASTIHCASSKLSKINIPFSNAIIREGMRAVHTNSRNFAQRTQVPRRKIVVASARPPPFSARRPRKSLCQTLENLHASLEGALKVSARPWSVLQTVLRGDGLPGTLHTHPRALFCIERCARAAVCHPLHLHSIALLSGWLLLPIACETCQIWHLCRWDYWHRKGVWPPTWTVKSRTLVCPFCIVASAHAQVMRHCSWCIFLCNTETELKLH